MSDYHRPATHPTARKARRCVACYYPIAAGETYTQQTGFYDGRAYRSDYHAECFEDLADEGDFEFTPGFADPPERVRAAAALSHPLPHDEGEKA